MALTLPDVVPNPLVCSVYQNHQGPPRRQSQKPFVFNQLCGGEDRIRTGEDPTFTEGNGTFPEGDREESSGTEGLSVDSSGGDRTILNASEALDLALADALQRASAAGRWDVVGTLAAELSARRGRSTV